jgi:outer membrane protein X
MKRLAPFLALLALALAASPARAQAPSYQPIRVDLTFFGAYASADATSWGGGVTLEPKYNLTDNLSLGFRFDAAAFITQDISVSSGTGETSVSQGARAVTTFLAKADYYLTTTPVRPFVGIGLGLYRIGAGSQEVSSGATTQVLQTASSFRGFGFCPQLGVNFGGFRLAATYHVVTGGEMVVATQAVGAPAPTETKLSKNFFAFELGGTFGGASRVGAVAQ